MKKENPKNMVLAKSALIVVDIQNDFLTGGALAVKDGDQVIPIINQLLHGGFEVKVATKDWHPKDHGSFAITHGKQPGEIIQLEGIPQILWPTHCVQESYGAEFSPKLDVEQIESVFYKGTEKNIDSYSTFFDTELKKSTGLTDYLKDKNIKNVYIVGLATDYCVKYSVLDACQLGFNTYVIADACRGVNLQHGDANQALKEMAKAGAHIVYSEDLLQK